MVNIMSALLSWTYDELDNEEILELFQALVDTGIAWQFEGHIGRSAANLLEQGLIEPAGR